MLFITAFWNRNNTVTNNTAQNNNTKEKKAISPSGIKKGDLCSVNIHVFPFWVPILEKDHKCICCFHFVYSFYISFGPEVQNFERWWKKLCVHARESTIILYCGWFEVCPLISLSVCSLFFLILRIEFDPFSKQVLFFSRWHKNRYHANYFIYL